MRLCNAEMDGFLDYIHGKDLYIYGLGEYFQRFQEWDIFKELHCSVAGLIDNGRAGERLEILGRSYTVQDTGSLKKADVGIVLLCSTKQLDSMYRTLCEEQLPDAIECFALPLIWAVTSGKEDPAVKKRMKEYNGKDLKIEKKIHCFWFSGEKKPEKYQRCVDTWKKVCPEYEIIEWNADTYDCGKNRFVKQAYEKKKWAFISDYARLDVVNQHGGIYLDMDVELVRPMDCLLQFDSFFNFDMQCHIDLGSGFGSVKGNPFLEELMQLYQDVDFCDENGEPMIWKYVQPEYIRNAFQKKGVRMDGSMQMIDEMLVLPRSYQSPKDCFLLEQYVRTEDTISVHHYNSDWCGEEFLKQRRQNAFWRETALDCNGWKGRLRKQEWLEK